MEIELLDKIETKEPLLTLAITNECIYFGGLSSIVYKYMFDGKMIEFLSFNNPIRAISVFDDFLICCSYKNAILMKKEKYIDIVENIETEIKGVDIQNTKIGISTRGCDVWILDIIANNDHFENELENTENYILEVRNILNDHTQDVKGVKFHNNLTFTFGYDHTIKIYEDQLIESIVCESTVWDVIFNEYIIASDNLCNVYYFDYDYTLVKKISMSKYPITKMCNVEEMIIIVYNRHCIAFIENFEIVKIIKVSEYAINCIEYNSETHVIGCVDDRGCLFVYKLKISF